MELLMKKLGLEIPVYNPDMDPVKHVRMNMLPEEGKMCVNFVTSILQNTKGTYASQQ